MSTGIEPFELSLMQGMTQEQRMMFQMQYSAARRNPHEYWSSRGICKESAVRAP